MSEEKISVEMTKSDWAMVLACLESQVNTMRSFIKVATAPILDQSGVHIRNEHQRLIRFIAKQMPDA